MYSARPINRKLYSLYKPCFGTGSITIKHRACIQISQIFLIKKINFSFPITNTFKICSRNTHALQDQCLTIGRNFINHWISSHGEYAELLHVPQDLETIEALANQFPERHWTLTLTIAMSSMRLCDRSNTDTKLQ